MARNIRYDMVKFNEWLKGRPQVIQDLAAKYPPDRLYNYAPHNQKATLYCYNEDGTVGIRLTTEFNFDGLWLVLGDLKNTRVFDAAVDKLTECALPPEFDNSNGDWSEE